MQYQTKELHLILHPNNILEIYATEEGKGHLTVEEIDNNIAVVKEITNSKRVAVLIITSSVYVKKEVLKEYSDLDFGVVASALVGTSFGAKLIGNLFLSLTSRFNTHKHPTKMFTKKEVATQWLEEQLAQ